MIIWTMEIDEESLNDFLTESKENLDVLELSFVELESDPKNLEILNKIFRAVHTIKGSSSFLGFSNLEKISHSAENVLDLARHEKLSLGSGHISLLLKVNDLLVQFVEHIEKNRVEPDNPHQEILEQLRKAAAGDAIEDAATADVEAEEGSVSSGLPDEIEDWGEADGDTVTETVENSVEGLPAVEMKKKAEAKGQASAKSEGTIRVDVRLLDKLMNLVGELVLSRNQLVQVTQDDDNSLLSGAVGNVSMITSMLQEDIMKTRMQPINNVLHKFIRTVRDLSQQLKKEAELVLEGKETELDRSLLEAIRDPLTHIIRNAVDHGIEPPQEREKAGKPRKGKVLIAARHEGGNVIIEIKDDGKGMDRSVILKKAIEKGLTTEAEGRQLDDEDVFSFIMEPGFSTNDEVTNISGRGVGMDVVKTNISAIGGLVSLDSVLGEGSTFRIQIPLTLAIIPALTVRAGGMLFAIPQNSLLELILIEKKDFSKIEVLQGTEVYRLRGKLLPLVRLGRVLDLQAPENPEKLYIAVLSNGNIAFGLVLDDVEDSGEIVVKPLSNHLKNCQAFAGTTIMGNGDVSLILDIIGISNMANITAKTDAKSMAIAPHRAKVANSAIVFSLGAEEQFAVQLSQITRLEEMTNTKIEHIGMREVIQYRGGILPLIRMSQYMGFEENISGEKLNLIVYRAGGHDVGLIVDEIVDAAIMAGELNTDVMSRDAILGTLNMNGKLTMLIDIIQLTEMAHPEWFAKSHSMLGSGLEPLRVLYVEDSAFYRNVVTRYLKDEGYETATANNGVEALKLLEKESFDILVIDIEMPEMSGDELVRILRQKPEFDSVPMMILSALTSERDREDVLKCGVQSSLIKIEKEEFIKEMERLSKMVRKT